MELHIYFTLISSIITTLQCQAQKQKQDRRLPSTKEDNFDLNSRHGGKYFNQVEHYSGQNAFRKATEEELNDVEQMLAELKSFDNSKAIEEAKDVKDIHISSNFLTHDEESKRSLLQNVYKQIQHAILDDQESEKRSKDYRTCKSRCKTKFTQCINIAKTLMEDPSNSFDFIAQFTKCSKIKTKCCKNV
ncbi:uncharacterized protein LOC130629988 [Hydractinia symbiolongicarpus]|uniref:uncharacterized protein LOC130629988 n=1 Tax=Hydractinia symbiolongicarpus TaxID=13093 RepID=UPI0025505089|nr:uncharacterized protein LOC130629988 [Hydractinia symbiolongicarpus]